MTIGARMRNSLVWRGGLGVAFGLFALFWPGMTMAVLVALFGVYALLDGVAAIGAATRAGDGNHTWAFLLEGLAGVGLGLAVLLRTRMAIERVVLLVALWGIATGVLEILAALRLRGQAPGTVLLAIAGATSLCLGGTMLVWPREGAFALIVLMGCYALLFGVAMLAQAFRIDGASHG